MRVAIDIRKLRDYGIGTYVRNIVTEIGRLDTENEYVLISRPDGDTGVCMPAPLGSGEPDCGSGREGRLLAIHQAIGSRNAPDMQVVTFLRMTSLVLT